jgi:hypothetical protein
MLPIPHNAFEPLASNSWRVRLNYWILTHFSHVRRWLIIGLVTASVLLYGWAAWRALPIIKDPHLVSRIADQIQNMKPFIPTPPQQLEVSEVSEASHERGGRRKLKKMVISGHVRLFQMLFKNVLQNIRLHQRSLLFRCLVMK